MPELDERIRALIDEAAPPVTLDEVRRPSAYVASPPLRWHRRRTPLLAGVAAVVVAALALSFVVLQPSRSSHVRSVATNPSTTVATACNPQHVNDRCAADVEQAQAVLGLDVKRPGFIPEGWVVERSELVRFPDPVQHEGVVVFNRAWTPPGEDMTTPGLTPTYIQLKVSASLGDLSLARLDPSHWVTLADGSMAYARDGWLQWVSNGAYYRIISFGVGEEVALQFANGLR